jgi:hypothetical protein
VPDSASYTNLALRPSWKHSPALHARVDFGGGTVTASADAHTKKCWSWGFTQEERDLIRRTTSSTLFQTDPLMSDTSDIELSSLDGTHLVTLRVHTAAGVDFAFASILTFPVNDEGNFTAGDRHAVNLGHLYAVVELCDPDDSVEVKVLFGRNLQCSAPVQSGPLDLFALVANVLASIESFYVGEHWCSPRRMLVP